MQKIFFNNIKNILSKNNVKKILKIKKFKIGRNNQVWQISTNKNKFIIKIYPNLKKNVKSRLLKEFNFLKILEKNKLNLVPKSVDIDKKKNLAMYTFLPGKKIRRINSSYINQCVNFIQKINSINIIKKFEKFSYATESCLSIKDHLFCVERRIKNFKQLNTKTILEKKVYFFFKDEILPEWQKVRKKIYSKFSNSEIKKKFTKDQLIVSPSDFGFHNIVENNKKLFFVDFEYAGWDDPAKLICDFVCQPDYMIKKNFSINFMKKISSISSQPNQTLYRTKEIIPIHRIKWCLVLLNEFIKQYKTRRKHAGYFSQKILHNQFKKSQKYFNINFKNNR
jgi:thiamine kinase-like enzyme